jgi:hypothetical protein
MEVEVMSTSNRLPKTLQRLTEIGIAITAVVAVVLLLAVVFTDSALETPMEFTPGEDTYSLSSEAWGTGTILDAVGVVRFTDKSAAFVALSAAKVLTFAAASLTLLVFLRRILQTLSAGTPFVDANAHRIRAIGILIPAFGFLIQGLHWASSLVVMDTVTAEGLHIEARLTLNLTYLFIGLVIVAIAEAFRYGTHLQADADLTI